MASDDDHAECDADGVAVASTTLDSLPADALLRVALWLPTAADAQRLLCWTSRAVRQRVEGHLRAFRAAWLLHNHPATALTRAARSGDASLLPALLAAPGERPDKDDALAVAAAGQGSLPALDLLLAAGAATQVGLVAAAGAGAREAVRALMGAGADPFADGAAAVRAACIGQHAGVLGDMVGYHGQWFVHTEFLPNVVAVTLRILCDPFLAAARAGDWAAAEALLRSGHVDRSVPNPRGNGRMHRDVLIAWAAEAAADAGHGDVAVRLVAAARVQGQDMVHHWALTAAACRGRIAVMRQLMERPVTSLGRVLCKACRSGSIEAVRVLRAAGAEVDGDVVYAAAGQDEGEAVAVLHVLLESGAPDAEAWDGAFQRACRSGQAPSARALLEACGGCRGFLDLEKALRDAVGGHRTDIVQALLQAGARVERLGPDELQGLAGRPLDAMRRVLQAAGVDFGGVDAAAAGADGGGQAAL